MTILSFRSITHSFGGPPVLEDAALRISQGDRVCIIGRNGEGKSTLLRIIRGDLKPDRGVLDFATGSTFAFLGQEVPDRVHGSVLEVVTQGLGEATEALVEYQDAVSAVAREASERAMQALADAQAKVDAIGAWDVQHRVEAVLTKLGLSGDAAFHTLSGGWRRRVFLARALVSAPDLLILDEPTNHLDVEAVEWLEGLLTGFDGAILFITHDRAFLRRVATRIVDLDRGKLTEYPADFDKYLEMKEHDLEVEAEHDAQFDRKLADEEVWIRTGIKARRTRNEGRVRALKRLRVERSKRRKRKGQASFQVQAADMSGAIVVEMKKVSFAYDESPLVRDLSLLVKRKDRIGLIGPNGVGKTTLLKLLLGDLEPDSGTVETGTKLEVRYYDQLRDQLDASKTVVQTVVEKGDKVFVGDKAIHVIGYLRRFLFDDDQMKASVSVLSGGERNRLLLAKLFAEPANVLVLDEPTNDLDVETLQLLEELLQEFPGTVLLVSHDREFLDNVVTESLVFRGKGNILRVAGGYSAWEALRDEERRAEEEARRVRQEAERAEREKRQKVSSAPRMSSRNKRELAELPARIEGLENEQSQLHEELGTPELYKSNPERVAAIQARLAELEEELMEAFERWEELEALSEA